MRWFAVPLFAPGLFIAAAVAAEDVSEYDRFRLWNNCQPLTFVVQTDQDPKGGVFESITTAVRSRLRAARLYRADAQYSPAYLNAILTIGEGNLFRVGIELHKFLKDEANAISGDWDAISWASSSFGVYDSPGYVVAAMSEIMDKFIDEYLRVNTDAC